MKIGIIGAMDEEVATLKEQMKKDRTVKKAGMEFCEGTIGTTPVVIVKSGIGKVNAGICVQIMIDLFDITHVINTGVAGSLNNDINIGDVVISTDAIYHDYDATIFGYAKGEVPQIGTAAFPADKHLHDEAVKAVKEAAPDIKAFEGRVVSGDQFIASKEKKDQIIADFHGYCTEMEGAAVAQTAYLNNIPFVVIRAISDKANDEGQESYETFEKKAAIHCANIVKYMIENL